MCGDETMRARLKFLKNDEFRGNTGENSFRRCELQMNASDLLRPAELCFGVDFKDL